MSKKNNGVALLVHSCDRYQLLFKGFEYFFSKYWNSKINCNLYFASEENDVSIAGFENIKSGKGEWSNRLRFLLIEKIQEKFILYIQEDMWLKKKVNAEFFNQLFELAEKNNWQQVKLHSSDVYKTDPSSFFIQGFNISKIDNIKSDFLMSHQITLWHKDFLINQLHINEHPWRNERKATKRLKKTNQEIFHADYFAENGRHEVNINNNPLLRSEYHTISENGVLSSSVEWYLKEMKTEGEIFDEYASKLEYNYINKLTHDGNHKPRKLDIFKRIKNWLLGKG